MTQMPVKKIYLIGVCGTAMGALAGMLKDQGHEVTGSDAAIYPPISDFLEAKGISILAGPRPENLDQAAPDLVVVGNVVRRDNPEAVRMRQLGLDHLSLPQALDRYFLTGRQSVVAAGTHGKTTTAALLAWLLTTSGNDPSFLVGGIVRDFEANYKLGNGPHFVIEGDEYDTAYFDKGPKFWHYRPHWTILTGVEFDHGDIFADLKDIISVFERFVSLIPADGRLLVFAEDATAMNLAGRARCPVIPYGFGPQALIRARQVSLGPGEVSFDLERRGRFLGHFRSRLPGRHNLANTLAALGLLLEMGIDSAILAEGLRRFGGIKRRQEIIGQPGDVMVMDDFAHHPTAVRETLAALKAFYPHRRLVAVFEPRTNSSRRRFFQDDYPQSFHAADLVLVRQPPRLEQIPPEERFSSLQLVQDLTAQGVAAHYFPQTEAILAHLSEESRPGDLVAILSNGGFDGLHTRLLTALNERFGQE